MKPNGCGWVRTWVAAGALLAGVAAAGGAEAATLELTSSYRFTGNITCDASPCIRISGDNVRVSGRGFTVTCTTYGYGVQIAGSGATVTDLTFDGCGTAVDVQSTATRATLRNISATAYYSTGFAISGPNALVVGCSAASSNPSGGGGFVVYGSATGATIKNSVVTSSEVGIFLNNASGATLTGNQTDAETLYGIWVTAGSSNNRISRNTSYYNGTWDLVDDNANCGTNVWSRNSFASDNESGADYGPGAGCIQ